VVFVIIFINVVLNTSIIEDNLIVLIKLNEFLRLQTIFINWEKLILNRCVKMVKNDIVNSLNL
jgi:hypothetical protein